MILVIPLFLCCDRSDCEQVGYPARTSVDLVRTVDVVGRDLAQHVRHEDLGGVVGAAAHHRFEVAHIAGDQDGGDLPLPVRQQLVAEGLPSKQQKLWRC